MKSKSILLLLIAFGFFVISSVAAKEDPKAQKAGKNQSPPGVTGTDIGTYGMLNINNWELWLEDNGRSGYNPFIGGDGGIYPKGTSFVIFQDGFVYGGKMVDAATGQPPPSEVIRVSGQTYNQGMVVGAAPGGVPEDPSAPGVRLYRIRRDYNDSGTDLSADAATFFQKSQSAVTDADVAQLKALYDADWKEWPVAKGAPFVDRNGNGVYDPPPSGKTSSELISEGLDEPGVVGADPNSPADQVVWTVANDFNDAVSRSLYGSPPVGVELQITIWGYKRTDALGNVLFRKFRLINRGNFRVDSMFVAQWSDPDLGDYGEDFVGVDTTLLMDFVYNSNSVDAEFRKFGIPPPAGGYDFFQGPLVPGDPSDEGIFDLKRRPGFKNLAMTSFNFWSAGSPLSDPPQRDYEGTLRWWKILRGFVHDESTRPDRRFVDDLGQETVFPLAGDPVAKTGWIDGIPPALPPGDRRMTMVSGPFTFAPGDTQEVVMGVVAGLGADRLSSIAVAKFFDRFAQNTYDALFAVPSAPQAPIVQAAGLDGEVVLNWGGDVAGVTKTETEVKGSYAFQAYNVYQFPARTSTLADGIRLATYDVVDEITVVLDEQFDQTSGQILSLPVQLGTNSGIRRFQSITTDAVTGKPFNNGQEYYFAVTAYSVSTDPLATPKTLESSPTILTVIPQSPKPGVALTTAFGDTLTGTHTGPSDGAAIALVVDPTRLTGHTYEVTFRVDTLLGPVWDLVDVTTGGTKLSGQTNQTGDDNYLTVDGLQFKVTGAPNDFKDFQTVSNAAGVLDPPEGAAADFQGFPSLRPTSRQQVGGDLWFFHTGDVGTGGSYEVFLERSMRGTNFSRLVPFDWEMRFTAGGSFAVRAFTDGLVVSVPFELWNIGVNTPNDPSDDYRLIPWFLELEGVGQVNLNPFGFQVEPNDHSASGGTNDPFTAWIYWRNPQDTSPGTAGYDAYVASLDFSTTPPNEGSYDYNSPEVIARSVLINFNGGDVNDPTFPANLDQIVPEEGTVFRFISTKPNTSNDLFTLTAPAAKFDAELAKSDVERIKVFPNPYYAANLAETNRFIRFVTFNFLPTKATIRIFNVAGQMVRQIDKDDASQFTKWDLNNASNFPVASGMYIAHIDMPDLGATKILKFAIIQEQEILDVF